MAEVGVNAEKVALWDGVGVCVAEADLVREAEGGDPESVAVMLWLRVRVWGTERE